MKKALCCILSILLILICFSSCTVTAYPLSSTQIMMDTVITVMLYDGDSDSLDGAIELCRRYEQLFSKTVPTSDIYRMNTAGGKAVLVSDETVELLRTAIQISRDSEGAFDPTVLPLVSLWDIGNANEPPKDTDVTEALLKVDYNNIVIDGNLVTLKNGATVDLGGIAKGFIADKVKQYLKSEGVESAIINLGGNVMISGSKNGKDFSVGVQKPFGKDGELVATIKLSDKTAVTSGIYQRYFENDKKIYHHILDTKTGYPSDKGLASVTVIGDSSAIADGLSTACLSLGIDKGTALAEKYGIELIFITTDGEILLTDGLKRADKDNDIIITLKQ